MEITQALTAPPALPDRTDRVNFSDQVASFLIWWATHSTEIGAWTTQANEAFASFELFAAGLSVQTPTEAYNFGAVYDFPDVVAGPDGNTYRALEAIGYEEDTGPVGFTNVLSSAVNNSYLLKGITTTSHANKTYTFKVKGANRWIEVGSWSIRIYDGSYTGTVVTLDHDRTYGTHTITKTFGASPAANILVLLERNGGPGNDDYALYSAFLSESTDPGTNLLTGDGLWQTDFTGWTNMNVTASVIPASSRWHNLTGETKIVSFNSSSPTSDVAITTGEKAVFLVPVKWTLSTRQNKVEFKVATRRLFMPLPVAAL